MDLRRCERVWLRAIWETIFPAGASPKLGVGMRDLDVDAYFDEMDREMPRHWVLGVRLGALLIVLAPLLVLRRLRGFVALGLAERLRVLEAVGKSRSYVVRQLVTLVKMAGALHYGRAAAVRGALLSPQPEPVPVRLRRRERGPGEEPRVDGGARP